MTRFHWVALAFAAAVFVSPVVQAAGPEVIVVPADYHAKYQPRVFGAAFVLTGMHGGSFADKYKAIYALLARDQRLMANIKKAAATYDIDPIHIVGAIVGEHTYNMNVLDTLQGYYVRALEYVSNKSLTFQYRGETATELFKKPQFAKCETFKTDYDIWDCRETVWNEELAGRGYPKTRLNRVFFQPMYSGQTFGVGQIGPIAALMVTDLVHEKSGLPLLSIDDAPLVFQQIMSPDTSIAYIAASIRVSIDNYKRIAGFDISRNAGLTATLYNLGDSATRAANLKAANDALAKQGKPPMYPQENFYGWLINDKVSELRTLVGESGDVANAH